MPTHSSPTVKRRRLAAELRGYRDRAGLTIEEVAQRLEWSTAKISRIENARVGVPPRDVKFLLGVYGVEENGEEWEVLLACSPASRGRRAAARRRRRDPEGFETDVGLELTPPRCAPTSRSTCPVFCRPQDYARAVMRATMLNSQRRGDRKTRGGCGW